MAGSLLPRVTACIVPACHRLLERHLITERFTEVAPKIDFERYDGGRQGGRDAMAQAP